MNKDTLANFTNLDPDEHDIGVFWGSAQWSHADQDTVMITLYEKDNITASKRSITITRPVFEILVEAGMKAFSIDAQYWDEQKRNEGRP